MYDQAIGNALSGKVPKEIALDLVGIHEEVCRTIWCPSCKKIMDSGTAGVLVSSGADKVEHSKVVCGECIGPTVERYKKIIEGVDPGRYYRATIASDYNYDGTPKKKKKPRKPKKIKSIAQIKKALRK